MHLNIHDNLDGHAVDRQPVADRIGPFAGREFLAATARFTNSDITIVESETGAMLVEHGRGGVRFAGHPDLTDYHSPLGQDTEGLVAAWVTSLEPGTRLDLDSLPVEAADPMEMGLRRAGIDVERSRHAVAAVLDLPASSDEYLAALAKKQRHEVRRKIRRFTEMVGSPRLVREAGSDVVTMFCDLHRRSSGEKGTFMTEEMEAHFAVLEKEAGAVIDVLYGADDRPVAAAFGFEDATTTYLYNSSYEPEVSHASPGIVLVSMVIEDTIERGRTRFDFLKGDEIYKFRMGAHERPLYRLTGVAP